MSPLVAPAVGIWMNRNLDQTLFCPIAAAVEAIATNPNEATLISQVSQLLQLHTLMDEYEMDDFDAYMTESTFLNDSNFVQLGGNPQVLKIWPSNGTVWVSSNTTVSIIPMYSDIECYNGYIHVVTNILYIPDVFNATISYASPTENAALAKYKVMANGVANVMAFLPTEAAFNATSFKGWNETSVIEGWISSGKVYYLDNWSNQMLTTWASGGNQTLTLGTTGSGGYTVTGVNGTMAHVVGMDNLIQNGVIYWVDAVLWPTAMPNGANGAAMVSASFVVVSLAVLLNFLQ